MIAVDRLKVERDPDKIQPAPDQSFLDFQPKPIMRSDMNDVAKKIMRKMNKKKTDDCNDMENLYWHTHGSMLWQG